MPIAIPGRISLTKFLPFANVLDSLYLLQPGTSTVADVLGDQWLWPLWDDVIEYDPRPVTTQAAKAVTTAFVVDDELLRAARSQRDDKELLLWCALIFADKRLEWAVREVLTDADGRFIEGLLNRTAIGPALAAEPDFNGDKPITNILRNFVQAGIFEPIENRQTITGVDRFLPTAFAVPGLLELLRDRVDYWSDGARFTPATHDMLDFALSLEANRWLGLTREEFVRAARGAGASVAPTPRQPVPADILELHDLLASKRQVVLQGPPGTGKTHLAKAYIDWSSGGRRDDSRLQNILDALPLRERTPARVADEVERRGLSALWEIVQFHPSYEYVDFVRTLAAEPVPGGVTFVPRHRILSLIAAVGVELEARGVDCELVLVLDEVNRGNIPSIFGELLYALEYRGQPVATAYSVDGDASITIPEGLSVIGTMNTADRSIAVIDYALRRRFVFLTVPALGTPIDQHAGYVTQKHRAAARALFDAVYDALGSGADGIQVGPSYYLPVSKPGLTEDEAVRELAARFVYEVLPLLREYVLEGELDDSALTTLLGDFDVDPAAPTPDQVTALQAKLLV